MCDLLQLAQLNETYHFSLDIDECSRKLHSCHADAECENILGSYNCSCKGGYMGDGKTSCVGKY